MERWRDWGPYLAERSWGTYREQPAGDCWTGFPFEHARSRPYRWVEDGLAGVCDDRQTWCFALALWNGRDPILKERLFGLPARGPVGERWLYTDNTPTHSWMQWRYLYQQTEFPYDALLQDAPLHALRDGHSNDQSGGHWAVDVSYAKAAAEDLCIKITVRNHSEHRATVHVVPTLWFRNTWSWGSGGHRRRPRIYAEGDRLVAEHPELGRLVLIGARAHGTAGSPRAVACDNDVNTALLGPAYASPSPSPYPKDGICDRVVRAEPTVNPDGVGTKGGLWYQVTLAGGESADLRLRLVRGSSMRGVPDLNEDWAAVLAARRAEADDFWDGVVPGASSAEAYVAARRAFASLLWSKQFYHFAAGEGGDARWRHLRNSDVVFAADSWREPHYRPRDLAFQAIACAHADPAYAKDQLLLLCREWYAHPRGQLPGPEGALDAVGPPIWAWAARRVYELDGSRDHAFLTRAFSKLLVDFTGWINRTDGEHPAWTVAYSLDMLEIALQLAVVDETHVDLATKFFEHFVHFRDAVDIPRGRRLIDIVPCLAAVSISETLLDKLPLFGARAASGSTPTGFGGFDALGQRLFAAVDRFDLMAILATLLDEQEFLGRTGLRRRAGGTATDPAWTYVVIHALRRHHDAIGDQAVTEFPQGSGRYVTLAEAADELAARVLAAAVAGDGEPRPRDAAVVAALLCEPPVC